MSYICKFELFLIFVISILCLLATTNAKKLSHLENHTPEKMSLSHLETADSSTTDNSSTTTTSSTNSTSTSSTTSSTSSDSTTTSSSTNTSDSSSSTTESSTNSSDSSANSSSSNSSTTNSTTNISFTWEGSLYSLDLAEAIMAGQLILNITSPSSMNFTTKSIYNGSFSDTQNLTSNLTYNGTLEVSANGFQNMSVNFSVNTSETTTLDFGQLNLSYVWPAAIHRQNLSGQAVALYSCNESSFYLGVNATVEIYILDFSGGKMYLYNDSSNSTDENGYFYTYLPIFQSSSGSFINYEYELKITPNNSQILTWEEDFWLDASSWEENIELGKITLEEISELTSC